MSRNVEIQKNVDKFCWEQRHKKRPAPEIYRPPIIAFLNVEPIHKLFYCPVQKAGSSFWMRTLTAIRSNSSNPYDILMDNLNLKDHSLWEVTLPKEEMFRVLKSAYSFMFVREPYGRLYSAYVDKLYYPNYIYYPNFTMEVARASGKNKTNNYDITFADTIKYLMHFTTEKQMEIDMHFKPMHMLCFPCEVTYKFIGKLETFQSDVEYLLFCFRAKHPDIKIKFDDFEKESSFDDIERHVNMLFFMIENTTIPSPMSKYKLLQRGWSDLHIRGYLSKHISMPFTETQASTVNTETFLKAIKGALTIPVDLEAVKKQREEAMVQAYRTVPMNLMKKLKNFLKPDCQMFGYNCSPSYLFKRDTTPDTKHLYLKGMK